ncbi:MAG: GDP-mannose 4,6-dehydratase [Anaerolineales bacterium]|nr:GDP-mannose 4,6-dehydratase [Anaerolineales bacterium]
MPYRALITGVSGFVGSHLAWQLSEKGWLVAGYDIFPPRYECEFFPGDLSDGRALENALKKTKPEVVFHLAGVLKSDSYEELYKAHVFGTISLMDSIVKTGLSPTVVVASSSAVYGSGKNGRLISETTGLRPQTHYALSKAAQEMVALRYFHVHGLRTIGVRTFNLLGPGLSPGMACSAFARQIALAERSGKPSVISTGNLDAKRDFVDVRDAVRAYELIARKGKPGEIYNVCSGRAVSIAECLSILARQAEVRVEAVLDPAKVQKNDVPIQIGSAKKLMDTTRWRPRIGLKKSLVDLLNDWRERVKELE